MDLMRKTAALVGAASQWTRRVLRHCYSQSKASVILSWDAAHDASSVNRTHDNASLTPRSQLAHRFGRSSQFLLCAHFVVLKLCFGDEKLPFPPRENNPCVPFTRCGRPMCPKWLRSTSPTLRSVQITGEVAALRVNSAPPPGHPPLRYGELSVPSPGHPLRGSEGSRIDPIWSCGADNRRGSRGRSRGGASVRSKLHVYPRADPGEDPGHGCRGRSRDLSSD